MTSATKAKFKSLDAYKNAQGSFRFLPFKFIKLDNERYILTNIAGEFIVLDKFDFNKIRDRSLEMDSDLYHKLKSKHFIYDDSSTVAIDLLALKYRTKQSFLDGFTGLHMFVVTLRCDHSCPYCQVSRQNEDTEKFDMSEEDALKALLFTFKSPSPLIKIEFQGGESLLNFKLIQFIVLKAKEMNQSIGKQIQFVIATNLSPVNDEILDFCDEHEILISTSLDGPEFLHNKNRPKAGNDSYQRAIAGINFVKSKLGPDKVSALMTTSLESLKYPREIIDEYISQGFNAIFLRSLSPYGFAIKTKSFDMYNTDAWLDFYKTSLAYIIEINKNGYFFVEQYTALILQKMLTPFATGFVDLQSPSGIGISAIVFNYDGDVYASDESRMLAEMEDKSFRLGNLKENSYQEIITADILVDALQNTILEGVPMCSDCAFLPYCGSDPIYHAATQGDMIGHKAKSGFCKKNMGVFKHIIKLLEDDLEAREVMMRWIRV
ncbi:MAG: His-Xaa-Ser system radical SAM maturase HxsB [Proteobacteria bacterium]|jgi:His-Xaa-Ser system radical SAM maturase HxsB|nr:His-Xaa-Ser system radical SAM maturase HxsB [Pseudomonadota bacterium]